MGAGDVTEMMRREHAGDGLFWRSTGESAEHFEAAGRASLVSPQVEWNIVVRGGPAGLAVEEKGPGCPQLMIKDRDLSPLHVYLERATRICPCLNIEEVVALRLWTGPMYTRFNFLLRSLCVCGARGLRPCPAPGPAHYTATLLALNSAVVKLIHHPPAPYGAVYRGLRLDFLPGESLDGVDPGLQAFSPDLDEASKMSCRGGREGLLLECRAAQGADVRWVSQFPKQNEVLFPAFSHVRSLGPQRCGGSGFSVWEVMLKAEGKRLEELAQEAAATATVHTRTHVYTLDRMHPHHTRLFFYPSPLYPAVWWSMGLACARPQAG